MSRKQFDNEIGGLPGQDFSVEDAAKKIFNLRADEGYEGRAVALATPIDQIWADVKQPRRAVPASIRLHWNGNPGDVLELLNQWHIIASKIATVDIYAILQGNGEGIQVENAPPIFTGYVELLRLAASIRKDGLINPISIIEQDGRNLIETGERRWLAYHILHNYMGTPEWSKIPASRSDGRDYVWRQATENTARRQLNAIGMARQLALLIMETRRGVEGQSYNDFDELVIAGGCDRKFYAQIANGNIHRVPRGMGERIQGAMGLSMTQLSQYRRLLRLSDDELINDALWTRADVEDWAELTLREITATLTPVKVHEIVTREEWGLEDLRTAMEGARLNPVQPSPPAPLPHGEGSKEQRVYEPMEGDKVRTPAGHMGSVLEVGDGRFVAVQTVNGVKNYAKETLTLMSRTGRLDEDWEEEEETPPQPLPLQGEGQNARLPIQRVDMSEYSVLMHSNSWPERYKGLKSLRDADEILFVQTAYGHMAVGAKISYTMLGNAASHYRSENTAIGQVFFAMKEDVLHELSKHRPVAVYKDKDQPSVNTFWVKNVMDRKPTAPQVERQMSDEEFEQPVRRMPGVEPETEVSSDKADSTPLFTGEYGIILHASPEWQFLDGLREMGKRMDNDDLVKAMTEMIRMTTADTKKINIKILCDQYADFMAGIFEDWHSNTLFRILQQLEQAGHDG